MTGFLTVNCRCNAMQGYIADSPAGEGRIECVLAIDMLEDEVKDVLY